MGERYKPAGHDFGLCETGRLLIISVGRPGPLSRQTCLDMNVLAAEIAAAAGTAAGIGTAAPLLFQL